MKACLLGSSERDAPEVLCRLLNQIEGILQAEN